MGQHAGHATSADTTGDGSAVAAADVARWAVGLGSAGVDWSTVRRLAVVVRHAGLEAVERLGEAVVEGPEAGRLAVRAVLADLGRLAGADAARALRAVADTMRRLSVPSRAEGAA